MPIGIEPLLHHLPAWLLVLFRLTGMFLYAPIFGSSAVPGRIKIFFALGLSFCVYPLLTTSPAQGLDGLHAIIAHGVSLWALVPMVLSEMLIGLVIGYGASLPLVGIQLGGRMISMQVGFGIAEVFSPGEEQSGILSELLFLMALVIFIGMGGHRILLLTLVGSFHHVPLGGFSFDGNALDLVVGLLGATFDLAIRVAAPLLCLVFLESVTMGFIMRTMPQMNILSVGFSIRIIGGVTLLLAALNAMSGAYTGKMQEMIGQLSAFFTGG